MDGIQKEQFFEMPRPRKKRHGGDCKSFVCSAEQRKIWEGGAWHIAGIGGPDAPQAAAAAQLAARFIIQACCAQKLRILKQYAEGALAVVEFENLPVLENDVLPEIIPPLHLLEQDRASHFLSAVNHIALAVLNEKAFAFDIDNSGKLVRFVANFRGGGTVRLESEHVGNKPGLSSHHGVALGVHSEAPYHATMAPHAGHSPAPSTLVLSARWNPLHEVTTVLPLRPILARLGVLDALVLSQSYFGFDRSDSFTAGDEEKPSHVPVIDISAAGRLTARYNAYRIFPEENAPAVARQSLAEFKRQLDRCQPIRVDLQPGRAIAINNYAALHARDVVQDNRRLLIRLFGYAADVSYIPITLDPLIVKG